MQEKTEAERIEDDLARLQRLSGLVSPDIARIAHEAMWALRDLRAENERLEREVALLSGDFVPDGWSLEFFREDAVGFSRELLELGLCSDEAHAFIDGRRWHIEFSDGIWSTRNIRGEAKSVQGAIDACEKRIQQLVDGID